MPAELAKLDAESAKRRNRQTKAMEKKVAADYASKAASLRATQHQADVNDKESIIARAYALLMLGLCRPPPAIFSVATMRHGRG